MDRFYGFDLGDAESAVTRLDKTKDLAPVVLTINEAKSFITAYALLRDGKLLIGEGACYAPDATKRKERFKSRFLVDPEASKDVKSFASGVLGELYLNGDLIKSDDCCFYVGCPAGWDKTAREEYRSIFEKTGYPPVKIISESRAALVSACQSKHLQVGYDILNRPVLVIDIGSSTTDFAYIMGGKEVELKTGGEVFLGGGVMDEILLEESLKASSNEARIRKIFEESEPWKSYCDFAARRLKEKYFSDEEYWKDNECTQSVSIRQGLLPVKLTLKIDAEIADRLLNQKVERLSDKSFREVFMDSLLQAKESMKDKQPELVFLTGGVSRMPVIRNWCREVFEDAVVITCAEPEFSVASGLAWCGKIDDELRGFKEEVSALVDSTTVEQIVEKHISELYRDAVETMVEPILEHVALPISERWRSGEIEKLSDIDPLMQKEIDTWLHTNEARALLMQPVAKWLKTVSFELEEYTMPICVRHNVPYSSLSLNSFLSMSDIEINVEAKNLFAVNEITWLIDATISIVVGLLCGGGGVALIANGLPGIIAGVVVSLLILALGKDKMQEMLLNSNIPSPVRRVIPKSYLKARMGSISKQVKENLYEKLEQEKNQQISQRLVKEISTQIESCLTKMAEVVEIPLG
ncbi:MAG: Hsp70 family protein [Erysipelotrichaceae bacterium]|nr:Hsp70 family protein [Erysipelotrichaceae bacterium]MBQ1787869.1 Hsp70 family protein [Erysipelotrichaceae bacterium]MBQ5804935.1 Hsp70 family protein [Erysipelotrichaceae bacterium]